MKTEITDSGKLKKQIVVTIEAEVLNKNIAKIFNQIRKSPLKGFRKGKAPLDYLKKIHGKEAESEAIAHTVEETIEGALGEANLKVLGQPKLTNFTKQEDGSLVYTIEVEVKPELTPVDYLGIEIKKISGDVTDEDITRDLEQLRERNAMIASPEGENIKAENGHTALVEFEGFVDGTPHPNMKSAFEQIEIGKGRFIPGFEENIIGMTAGEERIFDITFPADYQSKDIAGKQAQFKLKLNDIKVKKLPEIEELPSMVGDYESLDALKAGIRTHLEETKKNEAKNTMTNDLVAKLLTANPVEIPENAYASYLENLVNYEIEKMKKYNYPINNEFRGTIRESLKERAANDLKLSYLLEAIAAKENLVVADSDVEDYIDKTSKSAGQDVATIRKYFETHHLLAGIKIQLLEDKAINFLFDRAKIA